jgi:hypothetical protein
MSISVRHVVPLSRYGGRLKYSPQGSNARSVSQNRYATRGSMSMSEYDFGEMGLKMRARQIPTCRLSLHHRFSWAYSLATGQSISPMRRGKDDGTKRIPTCSYYGSEKKRRISCTLEQCPRWYFMSEWKEESERCIYRTPYTKDSPIKDVK